MNFLKGFGTGMNTVKPFAAKNNYFSNLSLEYQLSNTEQKNQMPKLSQKTTRKAKVEKDLLRISFPTNLR
jgi:hypothetical protein